MGGGIAPEAVSAPRAGWRSQQGSWPFRSLERVIQWHPLSVDELAVAVHNDPPNLGGRRTLHGEVVLAGSTETTRRYSLPSTADRKAAMEALSAITEPRDGQDPPHPGHAQPDHRRGSRGDPQRGPCCVAPTGAEVASSSSAARPVSGRRGSWKSFARRSLAPSGSSPAAPIRARPSPSAPWQSPSGVLGAATRRSGKRRRSVRGERA